MELWQFDVRSLKDRRGSGTSVLEVLRGLSSCDCCLPNRRRRRQRKLPGLSCRSGKARDQTGEQKICRSVISSAGYLIGVDCGGAPPIAWPGD